MKVRLFLFVVFCSLNITYGIAQKCKVQGVVRYEFNDYVGYKADIGAEINFIAKEDADSLNISCWDEYEKLAKKFSTHLIMKQTAEDSYVVTEDEIRSFSKFSVEDEERLKELDSICMSEYFKCIDLFSYVGLVDNSGKYEIEIPYGEYYVIAKSANRERPTATELTGRVIFKIVKIDKPVKILSFDFDY